MPDDAQASADNLIAFNSGDVYFTAKSSKDSNWCMSRCKRVRLDDHRRVVVCAECGKVIDPFDYLLKWAYENDSRTRSIKSMDVLIKQRSEEARALRVEIQNLKAQRRRLVVRSFPTDASTPDTKPQGIQERRES